MSEAYSCLDDLHKILCILIYGLVFEDKIYRVYSFSYDEYIKEYVFSVDDDTYFCYSDLDILYFANLPEDK